MRKGTLYTVGLIVAVALAVVAFQVLKARSTAGASYPPYSSHRADAQGVKALHDVAQYMGRNAIRSYLPLSELKPTNTTIVRLGLSSGAMLQSAAPSRENASLLAAAGNTVVLGLSPRCEQITVKEWQLSVRCIQGRRSFTGPGWIPIIHDDDGRAVVVQRGFGPGSVLLLAQSNFVNNGSLATGESGEILDSVLDRHPTVLFDEHRLGVSDAGSTGTLLRRYRLSGVLLATFVVFAMFVWKSATSFLPRIETHEDEIAGRDSGSGLANVLRRSVPPRDVMTVAIAEWAKTAKDQRQAQELRRIASQYADPSQSYNAVSVAFQRKRTLA